MKFLNSNIILFGKKVSFVVILWFAVAIVTSILQISKGSSHNNNYLIFKQVFFHTIHQQNLYIGYPNEYLDSNHYGPFFSIIIAPFALLPNWLGMFLWCMANISILFYATFKLPINSINKKIILLIGLLELLTSLHNIQFNPMLTAWIMLSYILVKNKKDFWATMFIAAGFMVKLYGIVGLAFFLFSDHKLKFIASFLFWMGIFFVLPMIFSSPQFIVQSYYDWFNSLSEKNNLNEVSMMQGMTVMRIVKSIFQLKNIPDILFLGSAALFYLLPLLKFKNLKNISFQLHYLAFLLIGLVIYSSSAESATFVIAMMGLAIWYVIQPKNSRLALCLMLFAILLTSLSTTDLFPNFIKVQYIRPYGLKALPCFFVWLVIAYQLLVNKFYEIEINE